MRFSNGGDFARLLLASASVAALATPALAQVHQFNIPAQAAETGVPEFGRQAHVQILAPAAAVRGRRTQAVEGPLNVRDALGRLIDNTGLSVARDNGRTIVLAALETTQGQGSAPSTAAEGPMQLEEIVVTAERREDKITDVPMSITALSEKSIERRNITSLSTYATTIPSVSFADSGAFGNELKIRGVGAGTQKLSPTTAVYLGDVPIVHTGRNLNGSYDFRVADMARIEVLNGPQGQLYGSNSLGGAVKYIPNTADHSGFSGSITVGGESTAHGDPGGNVEAVLNVPVTDSFAARAVAYYARIGGVYDNVYGGSPPLKSIAGLAAFCGLPPGAPCPAGSPPYTAGSPLGEYRSPSSQKSNDDETNISGARLSLDWLATQDLTLTLILATERKEVEGVSFAQAIQPGDPFAGGSAASDYRRFQHSQPAPQGTKDRIDLANFVVNYNFDWATLTSSTGYWKRKAELDTDVAYGPGGNLNSYPFIIARDDEPTSFTQEVRLVSNGDGRLKWLAGLFYQRLSQRYRQGFVDASGVGAFCANLNCNLRGGGVTPIGALEGRYVDTQKAVFGEVKYEIVPTLTAAVSFRYFEVEQTARSTQAGRLFGQQNPAGGPPAFIPGPPPPIGYDPINISNKNSEKVFTPKYNISWTPNENTLIYATAAKGFRTGVVNLVPPVNFNNCGQAIVASGFPGGTVPPSDADTLWNYEVGAKLGLFDKRVQVDASIYQVDWDNMQTHFFLSTLAPPEAKGCGFDMITNAGKAQNIGAELRVAAKLTSALTLDFTGSAIEAEYKEDVRLTGAKKGDHIQGVPRYQTNVGLEYNYELGDRPGYARVDWNYVGKIYAAPGDFAPFGGLPVQQGNYSVFNLRAGLAITSQLNLDAYAENIGDKRGVTSASDGNGQFATVVSFIRPRTVGANLRYAF